MKKELMQINPLATILFNIVTDIFAIVIERAKVDGKIEGGSPSPCRWLCHDSFYGA
jgi:hypothetical protein